jgi:hypothetical protein
LRFQNSTTKDTNKWGISCGILQWCFISVQVSTIRELPVNDILYY